MGLAGSFGLPWRAFKNGHRYQKSSPLVHNSWHRFIGPLTLFATPDLSEYDASECWLRCKFNRRCFLGSSISTRRLLLHEIVFDEI